MDGGIGEAALLSSLVASDAALPMLTAGEILPMAAPSFLGAGAGAGGLLGSLGPMAALSAPGMAQMGPGAGGAMLGMTPTGLTGPGSMWSLYGKPALGALGQAGKIYGAGNALGGAAGVPGFGAQQPPPAAPPMPPPPPPQAPSSQALGAQFGLSQPPAPGGSAAMVANRMSGPGGGGMSPQMMQALMMLLSRGGGIQ